MQQRGAHMDIACDCLECHPAAYDRVGSCRTASTSETGTMTSLTIFIQFASELHIYKKKTHDIGHSRSQR